jgi:ankyrin repeat protein
VRSAEFLVRHKDKAIYVYESNCTMLHVASSGGHMNMAQFLISSGVDLNSKDSSDCTPLMRACRSGELALARYLIQQGAYVDCISSELGTALTASCDSLEQEIPFSEITRTTDTSMSVEVAKLLIEKGADVDARDRIGWTPLMIAAGKGCEPLVRLLIQSGADKSPTSGDGDTALDLGRRYPGVKYLLKNSDSEI